MKITEVVPWLVAAEGTGWGEYLFVEVRTDEGVTGWGEITTTTPTANRGIAAMVRQASDLVAGDDPARIEDTWHKVFRAFTYAGSRGAVTNVVSAIDIALWDIRGKALGLPVCELLGGRVRDDLLIYTHPNQRRFGTPDGVVSEIRAIVDSGHTAIKFDPFPHPPGVPLANDRYLDGRIERDQLREAIELTALIREAAGPGVELLIDAHGRFDVPNAIRIGQALDELGDIHWYEEPVPPESYRALEQVRAQVRVPISVGERLHTRWDVVPVLEHRLADFLMPDVTWTGGISELKKIATMAEAYYVPISPHDAAGPVNLVAGGHVMATVPNFYRIETSSHDLRGYNRLLTTPLDNRGGRLRLPDGPGLGIELDREYLRAHVRDGFGG
ncbi:MAG TPA: mandelate racemase/muconate lactonizing enzyme family protein [Pseudonocardia sp.]|jgi:galactonate dehydratase|uniref:mandelate racemase/muconate lactonizing enzyme family protein n=1 Tax=Pseudonocardia sp. TaxID=60912 RepID=UPI002B4AF408|nr:mandelate racemase/muconate lactonizing enzyme family protein [Pseudonocardia sp.]HLU60344.1 mandelate racemase/muconate lactonizing enzyme family protein [Pseudonocardia sp.]